MRNRRYKNHTLKDNALYLITSLRDLCSNFARCIDCIVITVNHAKIKNSEMPKNVINENVALARDESTYPARLFTTGKKKALTTYNVHQ